MMCKGMTAEEIARLADLSGGGARRLLEEQENKRRALPRLGPSFLYMEERRNFFHRQASADEK